MADDRAYRVVLRFDAEKTKYLARAPELDLQAEAETRAEAISALEAQIEAKVEAVATSGETLPPPIDVMEVQPLTLELTPMLIRDLNLHARLNRLSVEALATQLLAQGIGQLEGHRAAPKPEPVEEQRAEPGPDARQDGRQEGRRRGSGGRRQGQGGQGGQGQGQGGRRRKEGYRGDLEDSSNWLEYVRNLEKSGGPGRGRR